MTWWDFTPQDGTLWTAAAVLTSLLIFTDHVRIYRRLYCLYRRRVSGRSNGVGKGSSGKIEMGIEDDERERGAYIKQHVLRILYVINLN